MSLERFINETKEKHLNYLRNRPASEVLLRPGKNIIWNEELAKAGYINVPLTSSAEWSEVHRWCVANIGKNRYTWTGNIFWFETEKDAIMFTLRWM